MEIKCPRRAADSKRAMHVGVYVFQAIYPSIHISYKPNRCSVSAFLEMSNREKGDKNHTKLVFGYLDYFFTAYLSVVRLVSAFLSFDVSV